MSERTFPVVEVFGPTVQGEGALAGAPTYFVRLGGCDYRCSWCDSMYAVEPSEVRKAPKQTAYEVVQRIDALPKGPGWVTISGGNPALFQLELLTRLLWARGLKVSVETQGSVWRDWLGEVDMLTVSPKPPSSGMATPEREERAAYFMGNAESMPATRRSLKIVVFDDEDYEWARELIVRRRDWLPYLSAGTPAIEDLLTVLDTDTTDRAAVDGVGKAAVLDRYAWLCERVAADPEMAHVRVLPQLHVLAWGYARGV